MMLKPVGKEILICHKKGTIVEENKTSYSVEIELGDVCQNIVVSKEYAENNVIEG